MCTGTMFYEDAWCICFLQLLQTGPGEESRAGRQFIIDEVQLYFQQISLNDKVIVSLSIHRTGKLQIFEKRSDPFVFFPEMFRDFSEAVWEQQAAKRYTDFLKCNKNRRVMFWELGTGYNAPGIIKYNIMMSILSLRGLLYPIHILRIQMPAEKEMQCRCLTAVSYTHLTLPTKA